MLLQAFTKYCVFTPLEMSTLNGGAVKAAVERSRQRLGVEAIDLLQFYWADYNYDKYEGLGRPISAANDQLTGPDVGFEWWLQLVLSGKPCFTLF